MRKICILICIVLLSGCKLMRGKSATNQIDGQTTLNTQYVGHSGSSDTNSQQRGTVMLDSLPNECYITPSVYSDVKIPQMYRSNNLRRRVGYATYASGQFIRIFGTVTDGNCAPVSAATIQIWHTDANGKYKNSSTADSYLNDNRLYSKQPDRFETHYSKTKSDENFTGSGTATTDNLGRFTFFTVMPGSVDKKQPAIMFRVLHKNFTTLDTMMYFPNNNKQPNDPDKLLTAKYLGVLNDSGKDDIAYAFNITLDGENKYLKY